MKNKTTAQKFRETIIDMNKGYPEYIYYSTNFKNIFGNNYQNVINTLKNDKIITEGTDISGNLGFRLTERGMDIANSIVTIIFTERLLLFSGITIILMIAQLIPILTLTAILSVILSFWIMKYKRIN